jgi:two-component system nitrogen regulation sensor histidine kinase NtrY
MERRERIFEALETTKLDGSGLGLFSVKSCVTALGGTVEVGDSPLGGARFRVHLPEARRNAVDARAPARPDPAAATAVTGQGRAGMPGGPPDPR